MKPKPSSPFPLRGRPSQGASAVLVVVILLALITLYGLLTVERLTALQRGLRRVEQQQLQKFEAPARVP